MINILVIIIFLVSYIPLAAVAFLLLEQNLAIATMTLLFVGWSLLYIYFDKLVLILLKAREIINTDEQEFFQILKNNSYKFHEKVPKIYLYDSQLESIFVLESRNQWSIVLSRKLLAQLDREKKESLIDFAYKYKKTKVTKLKTKCLGLSVIYQIFIHKISSYLYGIMLVVLTLFFMNLVKSVWVKVGVGILIGLLMEVMRRLWIKYLQINKDDEFNKSLYKSFFIFLSFLTKPFFIPLEKILAWNLKVEAGPALREFSLVNQEKKEIKSKLISNIIMTDRKFDSLVVDYIENYPLFLECEYKNEF